MRENNVNPGFPHGQRGWSVYIHFPFCKHRCAYCDFATEAANVIPQTRYTDAILAELRLRTTDVTPAPIDTIYFGGGTPSLWAADKVAQVLAWLDDWGGIGEDTEITLEANPGAVAQLEDLVAVGINRLSIGVQAVDDARLAALDRIHDKDTALHALRHAAQLIDAGRIRSASADLILGGPQQQLAELRRDVDAITTIGLPHLSVYALTVEEGTPLAAQVERGLSKPPSERLQADMLRALPTWLDAVGLAQYEVSNFAVPGHESRHNGAYWRGFRYLAVGVGAHGFLPEHGTMGRRYGNERHLRHWLAKLDRGERPGAFVESIDVQMHTDERLLTGLRLRGGIDVGPWRSWAGDRWVERVLDAARRMQGDGDPIAVNGSTIAIQPRGFVTLNQWVMALSEAAGESIRDDAR